MLKNGPYVNSAFICERALIDQDGVMSAIRIVDQISVPQLPPDASFVSALSLVLHLKAGGHKGLAEVRCLLRTDEDSTPRAVFELEVDFVGAQPTEGANIIFPLTSFKARSRSLFFDVIVNGVLLTVIPFRVIVLPPNALPPAAGSGPKITPKG